MVTSKCSLVSWQFLLGLLTRVWVRSYRRRDDSDVVLWPKSPAQTRVKEDSWSCIPATFCITYRQLDRSGSNCWSKSIPVDVYYSYDHGEKKFFKLQLSKACEISWNSGSCLLPLDGNVWVWRKFLDETVVAHICSFSILEVEAEGLGVWGQSTWLHSQALS